MKTIKTQNCKNQTVLVRVDYNVPIKDHQVVSDLRIRASLPTLQYLLEHGAKHLVLISHLGRPDGQPTPEFSLAPVAKALEKLLPGVKVNFHALPQPGEKIPTSGAAKITLLENLRFDPGEESNSPDFIKNIIDAVSADSYVQDGFAVIHRAHASTDAVKAFLPVYAGLLVENEVKNLSRAIENPAHPLVLIIGGAKVDDKMPLIEKFTKLADHILVGGKIAADGFHSDNPKVLVATDFDEDSAHQKLDIGPFSTADFTEIIKDAKTIIWNGCLGKVEDPAFATASSIIANAIGENTDATSIICGGDTTGFVENYLKDHSGLQFSLISTGGGASLEFLLGKDLPGLAAIE